MAWYLVFWRNRSTATVVPAASTGQARSRAERKQKKGYAAIVAARRANADDTRLIRRGVWVRRLRDSSSPQLRKLCTTKSLMLFLYPNRN